MKRNILFIAVVIGIILLEYGCNDNDGQNTNGEYFVIDIESTDIYQVDSFRNSIGEVGDTVSYNRFKIETRFIDEYRTVNGGLKIGGNSAIAAPLPAPSISMELDSIVIRNIADIDSAVVTSTFLVRVGSYNDYEFMITNDSIFKQETKYASSTWSLSYNYFLNKKPSGVTEMQFEFTYYLASGLVLKTVTESILVQP